MSAFITQVRHVKVSDLKIKDYIEVDFTCSDCAETCGDFSRFAEVFLDEAHKLGLSQIRLKFPCDWDEFEALVSEYGYKSGLIFVEKKVGYVDLELGCLRIVEDVDSIREALLKQQSLHHEFNRDFFEEPARFDIDGYLGELQDNEDSGKGIVYGLYDEEKLVGFVGVEATDSGVYINELFVDDKYRGKGFGKSLIDGVFAYADSVGAQKIWTTLATQNESALRFYRKYGFEPVSKLFYLNIF